MPRPSTCPRGGAGNLCHHPPLRDRGGEHGLDPETLELDFADDSLTANTRCAYPLDYISNASATGLGGHPKNIIMLTCDAFGVLPPIARLTPAQAMYHFLSGFTPRWRGPSAA
jgi:ATP-dependent phosphoenolpyruvate carboxykinase